MARVTFVQGDITDQEVDAIVNAANSSLLGGGGVDGAIHLRGGPAILEACRKVRKDSFPEGLPTGQAVATIAGNLSARRVIHTVGPIYGESSSPARELAACHTACLKVADELGARSIAFPAISTGVYGYPLSKAAHVAVKAVLNAITRVERVRFVLFDAEAHRVFTERWGRRDE